MLKALLLLTLGLTLSLPAKGSHVVGGEFWLEHLHGNTYELHFDVYRDCYDGVPYFNDPATVGMFEQGTHEKAREIVMDLKEDIDLDFVDDDCINQPNICTHIGRYYKTIELDPDVYDHDEGYYFSWERCCRNVDIKNIRRTHPNPNGSEGIAFYMEVPPFEEQPSTPTIERDPMTLLCADNTFNFDFSASNPDNDSLHYSIIEPIKGNLTHNTPNHWTEANYPYVLPGPYESIIWENGYGMHNIMDGEDGLSIDPNTGVVNVTPTEEGFYAVAIKVEYFEEGEKRGEVIRELQFHVASCRENDPPEFNEEVYENEVVEIAAGQEFSLEVIADDPNEGDHVYLEFSGDPLDSSQVESQPAEAPSADGLNQVSSTFSWTPTCEDVREDSYNLTIQAEDDGCPQPMREIVNMEINVVDSNDAPQFNEPVTQDTTYQLTANKEFNLNVIADDPNEGDSVFLDFEGQPFDEEIIEGRLAQASRDSSLNKVNSVFTWEPDCDAIREEPYTLKVIAEDDGCPEVEENIEVIELQVNSPPAVKPPRVMCVERIDSQVKRINYSDFQNDIETYQNFVREFRLIKVEEGERELLKRFDSRQEGSFLDQNAPIENTDDQCYFLEAVNICGDVEEIGYQVCSEDEQEEVETINIENTTVVDNENVEVTWNSTEEQPFEAYHIYRKERNSDKGYHWFNSVFDLEDTVMVDEEVDVAEESYCYRVEVSNSCGFQGTKSHKGCQIVLDGESNPFQHDLNWLEYKHWKQGVEKYQLYRTFVEGDKELIATIAPETGLNYHDEELAHDEGAYYYQIKAVRNQSGDDGGGSIKSASNEIFLYQDPLVHLPNAFSPTNEDDINDTWDYEPVFVREVNVQIYSRWGELLYETDEIKDGEWDGKVDGKYAEESAFLYKVTYEGWGGRSYSEKGTINNVR